MTVKYTFDVSTSRPWTLFKLLFRWRGSVWRLISFELFIWLILYAIISLIYRFGLQGSSKSQFEHFVAYLNGKLNFVPLDFMLGFFVTSVLNRWTLFFSNIGYVDNIALMVSAYVRGTDEKTRKMRRNIVRYCVLSQTLVFRDISMRVRKRFPTLNSVVEADDRMIEMNSGFMMEHEKEKFEEFSQFRYNRYWMPFQWALSLCDEARRQHKIASDYLLEKVGEEIKLFRTNMATLSNYDWVPLPIMYPQLIVIAVHVYFLVCAFSRQFIISADAENKSKIDIVFPVMSSLQFIFYVGWLKVAEIILNPFGEDDDDFECNFLLDKNLAERRISGITGSVANIQLPRQNSKMVELPVELTSPYLHPHRRRSFVPHTGTRNSHSGIHMPDLITSVKDKFGRSFSHANIHPVIKERGDLYTPEHGFRFPHSGNSGKLSDAAKKDNMKKLEISKIDEENNAAVSPKIEVHEDTDTSSNSKQNTNSTTLSDVTELSTSSLPEPTTAQNHAGFVNQNEG